MRAKIKEKNEVAKLTMEVVYEIEGKRDEFKAGQYFYVTLLNAPYLDSGKDPVHHFTIVNSPNQKGILSNATRLRDTPFKNSLRELAVGAEVEVDRIGGEFVLPTDTSQPLCYIALGIGITPYVSMMRYIREENLDYKITLFYSDSDKESMAFLNELQGYANENPNFNIVLTITRDGSWTGEKRHIDDRFVKDHLDDPQKYLYYISGPPKIVETVAQAIEKAGIDKENIKSEDFSGY